MLIHVNQVIAQAERINLLEKQLQTLFSQTSYRADTTRCRILNELADELRNADSEKSYQYSQQALPLAEKHQLKREIARCSRLIGTYYLKKRNYAEALQNLRKGTETAEQIQNLQEIGANLMNIGMIYKEQSNYLEALIYYEKSLKIFEKIGDKLRIASTLNNIGLIYESQSNYTKALEFHKKSLQILEKLEDKHGVSVSLNNIGIIYKEQGNYPKALEYYQKSLEILENIGNKRGIAINFNNLGITYETQGNLSKALEYYQKSLRIKEDIGDKQGIASSFYNIGNIYHQQNDLSQALIYHQKSLEIRKEIGHKQGIAFSLNNLGNIYIEQEFYDEALSVLLQSQKISEAIGNKALITYSLNALSTLHQKQAKYDKSIDYARQSLSIAQEIKNPLEIKNAYKTLYITAKLQKDYLQALEYFEKYKTLNDSLFTIEKSKAIANLENQVELEKKEKEIHLLAKDMKLGQILSENQSRKLAIIQKQAETDRLLSWVRQEKDKYKADSLYNIAQKAQLETDKLLLNDEKISAESNAKSAIIEKTKLETNLQERIIYLLIIGFLTMLIFVFFIYRSLKSEKKAKEIVFAQKAEIDILNHNLENLVEKRTEILKERNKQLQDYAFFNSHKLRHPVSNLLGLYKLYQLEEDEEGKKKVLSYFNRAVEELDVVVHQIQDILKQEKFEHF